MREYFHSVTLDVEKCKGCTNCIKRCPTEAIRVRDGRAKIIKERCIDCGECIRVCPYHAKSAAADVLDRIYDYKYTVCIPAPTLYGQFKNSPSVDLVLTGLTRLGFDDVFEVAFAAQLITEATNTLVERNQLAKPAISSACPAVLRLIRLRFPGLVSNIVPLISPMELAGMLARDIAVEKTGLKPHEIGIFFISPCAAKVTAIKSPLGTERSNVDGVIPIRDVYRRLFPLLKKIDTVEPLSCSRFQGISWARNGGEASGLDNVKSIAVDGIQNVVSILEAIEDDKLTDLQFLEASACPNGCVGGPLTVENPFVTRANIDAIEARCVLNSDNPKAVDYSEVILKAAGFSVPMKETPVMKLDDDMAIAMQKMERIEQITNELPQLDCGSCGAPSCRSLAEDIVRGYASQLDCVFKLREKVRELAREMVALESINLNRLNWNPDKS